MSDLISRQAAIDAVKIGALSAATIYGRTDEGSTALHETVRAIKALPSAQQEIIRCKDCEWWKKQKDSLQGRCELMQMYPTGAWYCGNAQRRVIDG